MTITLKLKPREAKKIPEAEIRRAVDELASLVVALSFLPNGRTHISVNAHDDKSLAIVLIHFESICFLDNESRNMLFGLMSECLSDVDSPFYMESCECLPPYEGVVFKHENQAPRRSQNSRELAKLALTIPDEYCCPLSADIMDDPIYDVRTPNVKYDRSFLMYWLRKNMPQLMPHTRLPYKKEFLRTDFDLKVSITRYVENQMNQALLETRARLLEKFKLSHITASSVLTQALRRAAMSGSSDDIIELLSLGACVNSQDDNEEKKYTALHWALKEGKFKNALALICAGATVHIKNADGITALDLIYAMPSSKDKEILLYNCKLFGFIDSYNISDTVRPSQSNAALFSRGNSQASTQAAATAVSSAMQEAMNIMD